MLRAVLDTNVLASGFANRRGPSAVLVAAWRRGTFELVASEHILDELAEAMEDRYFKKKLSRRQRKGALTLLRRLAVIVDITVPVSGVAAHAEDDLVLAIAVSAHATHLVTGDERFQAAITEYEGVRILSPVEFLALLTESGGGYG